MRRHRFGSVALAASLLLAANAVSGVELVGTNTRLAGGALVSGASSELANTGGTVRIVESRVSETPSVPLPEPGGALPLAVGLLLLWGLQRRPRARRLLSVALTLLAAASASAQVPQDTAYEGRLLDGTGQPIAGPVNLELRIFDTLVGGTALYSESHLSVAVAATGDFSVPLGAGSSPVGSYDADLFSGQNRYLEVVVGGDVLSPRQPIGAVPFALVAERANGIVSDPNAPRFRDCGDGSVEDRRSGLVWEKKTGVWTGVPAIDCSVSGTCPDPHDVNNGYDSPNNDLIEQLNAELDPTAATGCFARRCDWRVPKIAELQTIMIGPDADPEQPQTCAVAPCIDPDFIALAGPLAITLTWSRTAENSARTWTADFNSGTILSTPSQLGTPLFLRAVRSGSCQD